VDRDAVGLANNDVANGSILSRTSGSPAGSCGDVMALRLVLRTDAIVRAGWLGCVTQVEDDVGWTTDLYWADGTWAESVLDGRRKLRVHVEDSDYGIVIFSPSEGGQGCLHLGLDLSDEPYDLGDPALEIVVDAQTEAVAFARWAENTTGASVNAGDVYELLARPGVEPVEVFVEDAIFGVLRLAGVEMPPDDLG
jgi:hypothetical protein